MIAFYINPILRGGQICLSTTYRQFSPDLLIRGGSKYTQNLSFVIAEHIKLVPGQKKIPTPREKQSKLGGSLFSPQNWLYIY